MLIGSTALFAQKSINQNEVSITTAPLHCDVPSEAYQADLVALTISNTTIEVKTATIAAVQQPQNVSYLWSTGATEPTIQVTTPGDYIISTTNMCGTKIDTATVDFYFCDIELPNLFTPNNDGNNDYFQMLFYGGLKTFECIIVNRWGNTISDYTNPAFQWDGTDENGNIMEEGVYFYVARTITNAGDEIEKHGLVHLVRE